MSEKTAVKNLSARGNISILSLVSVIAFSFVFLLIADCCRIFTAMSACRKAADAAVLAVSQDLLFLERDNAAVTAQEIASRNGCVLKEISVSYDKVSVSAEKRIDFIFLRIFGRQSCSVISVSGTDIIYPWDEVFGLCKRHRFNYIYQ
ncbi:MAG: hypothetical protein FJW68_03205 [Actinobacteria bacterium]|nr:hypothetical protein [Actinomycetota bacterium]